MARHLNPASLRPAQTTTIQCGEMGRTTLGLSSKSVNHVAGLKCQRCPRPGEAPSRGEEVVTTGLVCRFMFKLGGLRRARCRTDYREAVRITRTQIRWQPPQKLQFQGLRDLLRIGTPRAPLHVQASSNREPHKEHTMATNDFNETHEIKNDSRRSHRSEER